MHPGVRRALVPFAAVAPIALFGCLMPDGGDEAARHAFRLRPLRGIEQVEAPIPGVLELRRNHRIGGYDAIRVRDGRIKYRKGSKRLTEAAEEAFVQLLRTTMIDAIRESDIVVAEDPGPCVMEIVFEVAELDLETRSYAENLAELIVLMRFRDSASGRNLLRYARRALVPHPETGITDDRQLRIEFHRIVREMNVTHALRPAGLATDAKIEGCRGVLGDRGRAATAAR